MAGAREGTSGGRLTTQEVADLLGVKTQTVYAYASRGLLTSEPAPGGRGSTFDAREVEALAGRRGRGGRPAETAEAAPPGEDTLVFRNGITLSEGGRLYYRGRDAVELAAEHGFETAVELLWGLGDRPGEPGGGAGLVLRAPADVVTAARRAGATLPAEVRLNDRLRVAVAVAASVDPLRFDLRARNVLAMGGTLIAVMAEALPAAGDHPPAPPGASLAERLWTRLTPRPATPPAVACLDQTLVLLADHGLAASTLAARVAASARANPYAVVAAGLGPLDGPLHGAASGLAYRLLAEVVARGDAVAVISEYLRSGLPVPGLGMRLYPEGDPRARALLDSLRQLPDPAGVLTAAGAVVRAAGARAEPAAAAANIDLALAVLSLLTGMPAEAGEMIFGIARTAGWIAHALEEYEEPVLRRPRGLYVGPRPTS